MDPLILILRPQPGADATAARAADKGIKAAVAPLFELRQIAWEAPLRGEADAILLTSANAARLGGGNLKALLDLPCFAVGQATAEAAAEAGFSDVRTGPSDGIAALDMAARSGARRPLHLCGRDHIALGHPDVHVLRRIVYSAEAISSLPESASGALQKGAVALLHSPRAGALFRKLVGGAGLEKGGIELAAISDAAAEAAGVGWRRVEVASEPRDHALLEVAAKLCKVAPSDTGNGE